MLSIDVLRQSFEKARDEYPLGYLLRGVSQGESYVQEYLLTPGNNAIVHRAAIILYDKNLNYLFQLMALYHEFGHLYCDLGYFVKKDELQREVDANEWVLTRLIGEGLTDFAILLIDAMKIALAAGANVNPLYDCVYQTIVSDPRFNNL